VVPVKIVPRSGFACLHGSMRRLDSVLGVGRLGEEAEDLYMGVAEKRGDEI